MKEKQNYTLLIDRAGGINIYSLFRAGRLMISERKAVSNSLIKGYLRESEKFYHSLYAVFSEGKKNEENNLINEKSLKS